MRKNICYTSALIFAFFFGTGIIGLMLSAFYKIGLLALFIYLIVPVIGLISYGLYSKLIIKSANIFENSKQPSRSLKITGALTVFAGLAFDTYALEFDVLKLWRYTEMPAWVLKYQGHRLIKLGIAAAAFAVCQYINYVNRDDTAYVEILEEKKDTINNSGFKELGKLRKYFTVVPLWVSILFNIPIGMVLSATTLFAVFWGAGFILYIPAALLVIALFNIILYKVCKSVRSESIYEKIPDKKSVALRLSVMLGIVIFLSGSFFWADDLWLAFNGWWF